MHKKMNEMSLILCLRSLSAIKAFHDSRMVRLANDSISEGFDSMKIDRVANEELFVAYTGVAGIGSMTLEFLSGAISKSIIDDRRALIEQLSLYVKGVNEGFATTPSAASIEDAGYSPRTAIALMGVFKSEVVFCAVDPGGEITFPHNYVIIETFSEMFRNFVVNLRPSSYAELSATDIEALFPEYRGSLKQHTIRTKGVKNAVFRD